MENKKQLIIIPPMSEALKKLNEVLESVSTEENIEISIIDDLKEVSQFLGTTGQCLILASSAKKCATFLQDNKAMLSKFHCKTILFTPKEIPAKTLIKFTKVGLTESILESSPPKTFLYKVKLLLRSIKTSKPQDDAEKMVKSSDPMKMFSDDDGSETKDKLQTADESMESLLATPEKNRIEGDTETIDYGGSLKGKNKHLEEALDTNWKSDKKNTSSLELIPGEEAEDKKTDTEEENIDMYYRGKQKKDIDLFAEAEDLYGKSKKEESTLEIEAAQKKSSYADVIEEGSMKQKRLETEDEKSSQEKKKKKDQVDLQLTSEKKTKELIEEESSGMNLNFIDSEEETIEKKKKRDAQAELELEAAKREKAAPQEDNESAASNLNDEMEYESAREKDRKKNTDLQLEAAAKEARQLEEEQPKSHSSGHEDDIDNIESSMIGNEGTVDHIETMMTSMIDPVKEDIEETKTEDSLELALSKADAPSEELNFGMDNPFGIGESEEAEEEIIEEEQTTADLDKKTKSVELDLLAADKKENEKKEEQAIDDSSGFSLSPIVDQTKAQKERESIDDKNGDDLKLRSKSNTLALEAGDRNHTHDGQVEKIDTFYRNGESKKNDQNWDGLNKRNDSIELLLTKNQRAADGTQAKETKDYGEITIDYRKLKEEFDMMESSRSSYDQTEGHEHSQTNKKEFDDAGSFQVIEVDAKSFDFSISVINAIYDKDIKAKKIFAMISSELVNNYQCFPIFYSYKLSDKKFNEVHNSFVEASDEKKSLWDDLKKDTVLMEHFQTHSMITWRCASINKDGTPWEDVELPTWAQQELKNKNVELVFPYFDGLDRMGMAIVLFPDGIDSNKANGLLTVLEMARTLFLDTIERYQIKSIAALEDAPPSNNESKEEKKGVLNFFGGLFGKKKAG